MRRYRESPNRADWLFYIRCRVLIRRAPMMALALGALAIGFAPVFAAFALKPGTAVWRPRLLPFFLHCRYVAGALLLLKKRTRLPTGKRPTGLLALAGFSSRWIWCRGTGRSSTPR